MKQKPRIDLKKFFWPLSDAPLYMRLMPYLVLGILSVAVVLGIGAGWTYTNSTSFCGTSCHTMPPQYQTYLNSSHARVECVECHLGRDTLTAQIPRKIGHSRTLFALIFHTYEYPIIAKQMRPATEACETCHYPQTFNDDSLREIKYHDSNEANTPESIFIVLKTGGGNKREGLGRGIHWHIENKVTFLATDPLKQNIPYVRVEDDNGKVTEYYDVASDYTPDKVAGQQLYTLDCIDCHNRASHLIPGPEAAVDRSIYNDTISVKLPYVRQKAVDLLTVTYPDDNAANAAIDGLANYYRDNYPKVYAEQKDLIQAAQKSIKTIYQQLRFPEQKLDWTSHPNNIGHKDSPGCFRCHDGKHLASTGEAVRLECNLCHSIPAVSNASQFVTDIEVVRGPEPASHSHSSWISLHGKAIDVTCARCHPPKDPKVDYTQLNGKPLLDGSFCGNTACHGSKWKFTGFGAPALQTVLEKQLAAIPTVKPVPTRTPTQVPTPTLASTKPAEPTPASESTQPAEGEETPTLTPESATPTPRAEKVTYENNLKAVFDARCLSCHNGPTGMANLDLSTYSGIMQGTGSEAGIVAGKPEDSLIYKIQSAGGHFGQMIQEELDLLKAWILAGAPEK
jgi:hypothetical protein